MPAGGAQFPFLRRTAGCACALLVLGGLGLAGWGVAELRGAFSAGVLKGAAGLGLAALGTLLYCQVLLLLKQVSNSHRAHDAILDVVDLLRRQGDYVHTMAENSSLSEWAKRIIYREKDIEFLRDTIHGAIVREDWETAEHLIRELDTELGSHEEARRLRAELAAARQATTEEKLAAALDRFEKLCAAQKWEQARRETQRLQALFPNDARIAALPEEVERRRQAFKRSLLRQYEQAVRVQDMERAHELLLALDRYLAPNEAAALKDSARGVFKARLQQMGVQFSLAVHDREFARAIEIGQNLMREFPNSRYAQEIAAMLPALHQRAQEAAAARGRPSAAGPVR